MHKKLILILLFWYLGIGFAQAAALKVQPSEIIIKTGPNTLVKQELIITNPDNRVALYDIYLENFSKWVKIKPSSFILESQESKKVTLGIKSQEQGIFSTNIAVVAKPLSQNGFKASSGVKIPLEIRISQSDKSILQANLFKSLANKLSSKFLFWILYIIFSCSLLLIVFWHKRRKLKIKDNFKT